MLQVNQEKENMRRKTTFAIVAGLAAFITVSYYATQRSSFTSMGNIRTSAVNGCLRMTDLMMQNKSEGFRKRLPQIIGIGSKKCGTGAFRHFLRFHSRVQVAYCEPHFFDDSYEHGVEYYKSLMPWTKITDVTFEKTPKYIVTKGVPERIKETYAKENLPTPKFVLVVCDPVQRAYSDFAKAKRNTGYKTDVVSEFDSFDDYVRYAMQVIDRAAPPHDDVDAFYQKMPTLDSMIELRFITRGIYSYFLENWYELFPRKDFVIVDGDRLLVNPAEEMLKAQRELGLKVEVGPEDFVYDQDKGFYCIKYNHTYNWCLSEAKGVTRTLLNDTIVQPKLSTASRFALQEFYRPFVKRFRLISSLDTTWVGRRLDFKPR